LQSDSAATSLEALWSLRSPEAALLEPEVWEAVFANLTRRDPVMISETAWTIAAPGRADSRVVDRCLDLLQKFRGNSHLEAGVALALGMQPEPVDAIMEELLFLLDSNAPRVVMASLTALGSLGPAAERRGVGPVLKTLRDGLCDHDPALVSHAVAALRLICSDPKGVVARQFPGERELKNQAFEALSLPPLDALLTRPRLPTPGSLPLPLPDWRPLVL